MINGLFGSFLCCDKPSKAIQKVISGLNADHPLLRIRQTDRRKFDVLPLRPRKAVHLYCKAALRNKSNTLFKEAKDVAEKRTSAFKHWKTLSPIDRQPYELLAKIDKERYESELAARGIPLKVKGASCRYFADHFKAKSDAYPSLKTFDISRMLHEDWKNLPDTERTKYLEAVRLDRLRYASEMTQTPDNLRDNMFQNRQEAWDRKWSKLSPLLGESEGPKVLTRPQKLNLRRRFNFPTRPGSNAFSFFASDQAYLPGESVNSFLTRVGRKWRKMASESKSMYIKRKTDAWATFHERMKTWESDMIADGRGEIAKILQVSVAAPPYRKDVQKVWRKKHREKLVTSLSTAHSIE